eukprot:6170768-Prymnesium_polylepis.2
MFELEALQHAALRPAVGALVRQHGAAAREAALGCAPTLGARARLRAREVLAVARAAKAARLSQGTPRRHYVDEHALLHVDKGRRHAATVVELHLGWVHPLGACRAEGGTRHGCLSRADQRPWHDGSGAAACRSPQEISVLFASSAGHWPPHAARAASS